MNYEQRTIDCSQGILSKNRLNTTKNPVIQRKMTFTFPPLLTFAKQNCGGVLRRAY